MKSELPTHEKTSQSNTQRGINLETVYRSLLKIVARLDETQYTQDMLRQTEVVEHPNLANPASEATTSQG